MLLIGMSQPVKLSDALVLDAHIAGEAFERSLTGQVEFWARLGRAVVAGDSGAGVMPQRDRSAIVGMSGVYRLG